MKKNDEKEGWMEKCLPHQSKWKTHSLQPLNPLDKQFNFIQIKSEWKTH